MELSKTRVEWIDLVRSLAIVCVVANHAIETTYSLSIDGIGLSSVKVQLLVLGVFTFGRLGVPIFLMISGYLLLDREWNPERTVEFWKRNWIGLLICTEIWWIIYNVFLMIYYNKALNIVEIIQDLIFVKKIDLGHVWYMPMILGMYILIPMIVSY